MEVSTDFKQLLWRNGFITTFSGRTIIDTARACKELHCSLRTLKRWLSGKPCPRAVALLKLRERSFPASWKGWRFDNLDRIVCPTWRHPKEEKELREYHLTSESVRSAKIRAQLLEDYTDTLNDKKARTAARAHLGQVINQLHRLMQDPVFKAPGEHINQVLLPKFHN